MAMQNRTIPYLVVVLAAVATAYGCSDDPSTASTEPSPASSPSPGAISGGQPTGSGSGSGTAPVTPSSGNVEPPKPTLSLTFVPSDAISRAHILDEELVVGITFTGDSVACSQNAGATFAPCTSDTQFSWNAANKDVIHVVRATLGSETIEKSFKPSQQWSNVTAFYHCTQRVSASEQFSAFQARIERNAVICIGDGVVIADTNSGEENGIWIDAPGVVIYARENTTAVISDTQASPYAPALNVADTDFRLIGVKVRSNTEVAVHATDDNGPQPDRALLYDSELTTDSNLINNGAVRIPRGDDWVIERSKLIAGGPALFLPNSSSALDLRISESYLESLTSYAYVDYGGHNVTATRNLFSNNAPTVTKLVHFSPSGSGTSSFSENRFSTKSSEAVYFNNSAANSVGVVFTNNVFIVEKGIGGTSGVVRVVGNHAADNGMAFVGNTFARADVAGTNGNVFGASTTRTNFLSGSNNVFCKQNASGATFTAVVAGTAQTTFSAAAQANGGSFVTCDSAIFE